MFVSKKKMNEIEERLRRIEEHLAGQAEFMALSSGAIVKDPSRGFTAWGICSMGEQGLPIPQADIMEALIKKHLHADPKALKRGDIKLR